MSITIDFYAAAVLLLAVILIYAIEVVFFWWKLKGFQSAEPAELHTKIGLLQDEIDQLKLKFAEFQFESSSSSELDVNLLEQKSKSESPESNYTMAIQLAQQGVDALSLVAKCGLSRAEADLIVAIYHGVYKG